MMSAILALWLITQVPATVEAAVALPLDDDGMCWMQDELEGMQE